MAKFHTEGTPPTPVHPLMIAVPVTLIGAAALSLIFMTSLFGRPNYKVGMYDAVSHPPAVVAYRGARLAVQPGEISLPDAQMVAVGYSDEGYLLYAPHEEVGGGGGGKPEWGAKPPAFRRIYLRASDGKYLAVKHR